MTIRELLLIGCGATLLACTSPTDGGSNVGGTGGSNNPPPGGSGGSTVPTTGAGGSAGTGGSSGSGGSGGSAGTGGYSGSGGSGGSAGSGGSGGTGGSSETPDSGAPAGDGGPSSVPTPSGAQKIFDGMTTDGWTSQPADMFAVAGGALKATGKGRGYFFTNKSYSHYRVLFSLKAGGTGGHAPCVLVFCAEPPAKPDACAGIQFQPPNGGRWDYRPGKNNSGGNLFMKVGGSGPAEADGFTKCELIANSDTGEAKMACGGKDVLHFTDKTAGRKGPFALQTHNAGISDQYKDIFVEEGITSDAYITVK
jgi:hypothetical protein